MKIKLTLLIVCVHSFLLFSQDALQEIKTPLDKSIKGQFEHLYSKANNYQDYKVVKREWLITLKKNTLDTLKILETKLTTAENNITQQGTKINTLNTTVDDLNNQLATITNEKDAIQFLGVNTSKQSYKTIMWSILSGLLALLLFFIYKFKKSNTITKEANSSLKELELEFEEHRRRALEREQSVMRKLQDEINKKAKTQ